MSVERVIFHVDMDAFFVSVEEIFDPTLKGKPVVVGGLAHERGVVAAASYEVRKFGVHSAMPLRHAYRLCPQAVFIPGHPDRYRSYSRQVRAVLDDFSPQVKMASIDEAYLDMTGSKRLLGPPLNVANSLHETIKEKIRLPCSIGIGTSRLVAKIASDMAKPNGILSVLPGAEDRFLAPLDVARIPGVGKVSQENLCKYGIHKIGQLTRLQEEHLRSIWGKAGVSLVAKSRGLDVDMWSSPGMSVPDKPKSISHETTFRDDTTKQDLIDATLVKLVQLVGRRLRGYGLHGRTIQLKLRYADFKTITRARTLIRSTQLDTVILASIRELFSQNWNEDKAIRLLGVQIGSLETTSGQLDWIDDPRDRKWKQALEATDAVRNRFGESSIGLASAMKNAHQERVHENTVDVPERKLE
ncbi:MAG: DNA polymerase IV [Solibacterales bacterium]|nr:DNA polymerase IV [Bryobacterales bacterium]|tara:strand:+ start:20193 stop:21431 length:1239 start_codon:yes stop_codon:yes gene_type:complete